ELLTFLISKIRVPRSAPADSPAALAWLWAAGRRGTRYRLWSLGPAPAALKTPGGGSVARTPLWTVRRGGAYAHTRAATSCPTSRRPPMRPISMRSAAVIAVFALLALPLRAHADLLVNGNFEDGPAIDPGNPIFAVAPGNNALTGWSVSGANV